MAELKTVIQLRNDTATNWEANKTKVLKNGEGIENTSKKYKMSARKLFILIICYKENARIVCSMNCLSNQLTHY